MTAPRIEVDLNKLRHNTRHLVERLRPRGIGVIAVTKAVCGRPEIAQAMLDGGAAGLGEARLRHVERLRAAGLTCPIALIRSPMLSQAARAVRSSDVSYNTELAVIAGLAAAAVQAGVVHPVMLMVELGDRREGIMPADLLTFARQVIATPGVALKGVAANFACLSGAAPDAGQMAELSAIASEIEGACGPVVEVVCGGNSANLPWALAEGPVGRINRLRLGEAILLGVEPVTGAAIDGLFTDAFTLVAEVIEVKAKPAATFADPALAAALRLSPERPRALLALGQQDTEIGGLTLPQGMTHLGATSDHMVVGCAGAGPQIGEEIRLQPNYTALMRAMNAPDVAKVMLDERPPPRRAAIPRGDPRHVLV